MGSLRPDGSGASALAERRRLTLSDDNCKTGACLCQVSWDFSAPGRSLVHSSRAPRRPLLGGGPEAIGRSRDMRLAILEVQ